MAANALLTTYGATATTFLTTTISLSSNQASFTILYPPPATEVLQYTTFPVISKPSSTYAPSPLPILILTNIVGVALNPSGLPIATRTLIQPPPPQATITATSSSSQAVPCNTWNCWSRNKRIGVCLGAGLGFLIILLLLFWLFFWRRHIKKFRIRPGRPGDEEGAENARPPLRIRVSTSMSQTRSKSRGTDEKEREENLTPSPPPGSRRGDGGVRIVAGSQLGKEPAAYRVVRQPSPREFVRVVEMPEGPRGKSGDGETKVRDFAVSIGGATVGAGVGVGKERAKRVSRQGRRREGGVRVSRGESLRESHGSRRERRDGEEGYDMGERSERRMEREREGSVQDERRKNQSPRRREENGVYRRAERREDRDGDGRRRRNSYAPEDEEDFEVRRDHSPKRQRSSREGGKRRPRSVSSPRRDKPKDKPKKRRDSESGIGSGLKKLLPLLPLVFGLMSTYGEPKGGWDQYIPEEKRKGKGKVKKMAEEAFDKCHHKIPEDFPRHIHSRFPRSKSADRAYRSTQPGHSSPPFPQLPRPRRESFNEQRRAYENSRESSRPIGNVREAFGSITPERGSVTSTALTPSPPPRRRRSTRTRDRERRVGGYDGADDDDFVVYSARTADGSLDEVIHPYEILEPESPVLSARTFPVMRGFEEGKGAAEMPPTPPSTVR